MTTYRILDLFSGIGGFSLGLERAGMQTAAFCEVDAYCQQVLRKHWPDTPIHSDIRTLNVDTLANLMYSSLTPQEKEGFEVGAKRKDYDHAVVMYNAGLSVADVADYYGITRQAMWAVLKRRGCEFRPNLRFGDDNHFYRGTSDDDRAQGIVEKAIAKGILVRQPCEVCGESPVGSDGRSLVHAHHCDYNKPLEVMWLCQPHHYEWHQRNKAVPRKEVSHGIHAERFAIDVVCGGYP
jgi:hypothetical protein